MQGGWRAMLFRPPGIGMWDEFLEVMEWARQPAGPDGLVTIHNTRVPMFAAENFADYICRMEWGYGEAGNEMPETGPLPWNGT